MPQPSLPEFASALISGAHVNITRFPTALKDLLKSKTVNLKECESNDQIISKFSDAYLTDIQKLIEEHVDVECLSLLEKSDATSDYLRAQGNEHYKAKRVREALRCYTLAAAFAPNGSRAAALAYSNRSACFFESNNLSSSLNDILRFESIYSTPADNIASRLRDRKQKCEEKLTAEVESSPEEELKFCTDFFKLKSPNATIPSAESFIGIKNDEKRGRHVVNAGDKSIPPGQLIILEPPYSHVLLRAYSFEYKHCTTCLKDLQGGGVPCTNCVFALYCSDSCAESTPHTPPECEISRHLYTLNMDRTIHLSLSILLKSPSSVLTPDPTSSPHPLGFTPEGHYPSTTYHPIRNLIYHRSILTNEDLLRYSSNALIITSLLSSKTTLFTHSPPLKQLFQSSLLLHQMNLPCNAHSLYKLSTPVSPTPTEITSSEYEEIGAGAFSLLSLINHSCDPNVVRITLPTGLNAVLTLHTIPPNAEILDNYGVHFATDALKHRQSHLSSLYNFTCDCTPCTNNWPSIYKLMKLPDTHVIKICTCKNSTSPQDCEKCKEKSWKHEYETALKSHKSAENQLLQNNPIDSFKSSCSSLDYFDKNFRHPFKLVCISQEYMKQALFLITRSAFR